MLRRRWGGDLAGKQYFKIYFPPLTEKITFRQNKAAYEKENDTSTDDEKDRFTV